MDWQELIALVIVAITVGLFALTAARRRRRRRRGIETHCDCAGHSAGDRPPGTVLRSRKGARPQLVVKMK